MGWPKRLYARTAMASKHCAQTLIIPQQFQKKKKDFSSLKKTDLTE